MKKQNETIPIIDDHPKTKEEILRIWDEMEKRAKAEEEPDSKKITA